jgi:hypothetical protein
LSALAVGTTAIAAAVAPISGKAAVKAACIHPVNISSIV